MGIGELAIDISIFSGFTLYVWYFNLKTLPTPAYNSYKVKRLYITFIQTILLGFAVMVVFVTIHQLLLPKYPLASMMGMYEFRGLIINIIVGLFLFLFYQNHLTNIMDAKFESIKMDHLNARYELLKQQINPHFLFNSLSTLKSMVEAAEENASTFIDHLASFYRSSLEKTNKDLTNLYQELQLLQNYLYLLNTRYDDCLLVTIKIPEEYYTSYIPPFTLQLLLENAIKHNVLSKDSPLEIRIYIEKQLIIIENYLNPRRSIEITSRMGLKNIQERYQKLFNKLIVVEKTEKLFCIKLPLIHEYHNYRR